MLTIGIATDFAACCRLVGRVWLGRGRRQGLVTTIWQTPISLLTCCLPSQPAVNEAIVSRWASGQPSYDTHNVTLLALKRCLALTESTWTAETGLASGSRYSVADILSRWQTLFLQSVFG